ncbi:amino acid transporter [Diplodia corticola]|uniref:Amino acid transporter n=1 Tax=Diplodia corticola TaxID=236234 RepID=A0A1J9RLU6_9PEZI|nr:amino acid transporter [Diplodia corticola]OJD33547.1 amino acid transporter [Diplodia corticola]
MPRSDANDADEVLGLLGNAAHQELELELEPQHHQSFAHRHHHTDDLGITSSQSPYYYDTNSNSNSNNNTIINNGSTIDTTTTSSPQSLSPSPSPAPGNLTTTTTLTLPGLGPTPTPTPTSAPRSLSASPAPSATPSPSPALALHGSKPRPPPRRQSSFAQPRPDGTPRTPNRVRFDEEAELIPLEEHIRRSQENGGFANRTGPARYHNVGGGGGGGAGGAGAAGGGGMGPRQHPYATRMPLGGDSSSDSEGDGGGDGAWAEEEDFLASGAAGGRGRRGGGRRGRRGNGAAGREQRLPLLTDIEAPSVTVANSDVGFSPEDLLESARPKSGLRSAFMNMANSIIGAGIIGQPYAFRQAGLLTGIVLLVLLTATVDWTIRLIVVNSKLSGANSFQATVQHCFGNTGLIAISVAQWAFAFGGMIAFCIIVGDTIPHVMEALFPSLPDTPFLWLLTDRRAVIVFFTLGVSYPLSLYRDISKLAKASTLALISMLIILVAVVTQGPGVPQDMKGQIRGSLIINDGVFQAVGVISFDHNSLLIYGSLKKPTIDRFSKVTHFSTTVSMIACLLMALSGYLTFGDKTQGNVLNNFPTNNVLVNVARLCFGLNMLSTLPLEAFVCREVMENFYFPGEPWDASRHLIFTTTLVTSAMGLSLMTCDLGVVFELVGATSACALAYILPPLCFLKLSKKRSARTERICAMVCVAFGCSVLGVSLVLAVTKMMRNEGNPATCG